MKGMIALADSMDREAWLEARTHVTTATQAATIAGSHPYTKLIDVWNEKTSHDTYTEERNDWLDIRAAVGRDREPAIVAWASEQLGVKLTPNTVLWANPDIPGRAATPDAYAYRTKAKGGTSVVVDAKTTQQNWHPVGSGEGFGEAKGIPQHVMDQMLWEWGIFDADEIWLAVEQYSWDKKTPTLLDSYMVPIPLDDGARRRLEFLVSRVAVFDGWITEGIAPESDVDMRAADFDDTPEEAAARDEVNTALGRIADIEERIAADVAELKVLKDRVSSIAKQYEGRRVHLIGDRLIAQLVRFPKAVPDYTKLNPRDIAATTTWREDSRVVYVPNPEYIAPTDPTERGQA